VQGPWRWPGNATPQSHLGWLEHLALPANSPVALLCPLQCRQGADRSPASRSLLPKEVRGWQMSQAQGHRVSGLLAARGSALTGGWVSMDEANTPGTKARVSQDTSAPGTGKGGPGCARGWLVFSLAPAQQNSLLLPACSPRWSAVAPFPPQRVWLLLALISCALSPTPPSPAHPPVRCTAKVPTPSIPADIPARWTDALCSPPQLLAETRVPPWGACPTVPPTRVQAEVWGADGWASTGHGG